MRERPHSGNTQTPDQTVHKRCFKLGIWVLGFVGASLLLAGCGRPDVELVKVSGYLTLDGQPPPGSGTIYFTPYESLANQPLRPTRAEFGPDGFFRASAFGGADGLIPAKYRIGVHCWEVAPSMDGPPPKSYIPEHYANASTSGLELLVPSGAGRLTYDVKLYGAQ